MSFVQERRAAMRGYISIIIGIVFVIGGLTGNMSLRGTNSGVGLAVVGGIIILIGIYRVISSRT